ncbi:MAG TPA: phospholipase D-like domain-containing protein [Usitatibacter sp.]|nr:phospholipase D-like domain-containing protein [Usitatibacter sp.]
MPLPGESNAPGAQPRAPQGRVPVRAHGAARLLAFLARGAFAATVALGLASCATPSVDRYLLRAEAESGPVRVKGSRGYLSREQSRAVLDALKKKAPDAGAFERHVAIEESLSGNPLSVGNRVALLEDGKATYDSMLGAIRAARHHVHMETYIFEDDDTGYLFADALIERAKSQVKVRLIYDAAGSISTPKDFFKRMADAGVEVFEFNPIDAQTALKGGLALLNQRDHRKVTIVDGRVAFLGGINISDVYGASLAKSGARREQRERGEAVAPKDRPWRDMQTRIEGPAVAEVQRAFLGQWARRPGEPPITDKAYFPVLAQAGPHIVRVMEGSPKNEGLNDVYAAFISAIDNAEKEVRIMNPYFVPHEELRRALREAAQRGVEVSLILPGHSDSWLTYYAGRSYYGDLLEAGVKIYERRNRILHAKSATVDGVWSTVGSTNLDWRSLLYNEEINVVVLGSDFANDLNQVFRGDIANSDLITRESWAQRPLDARAKEAAAKAWARLL